MENVALNQCNGNFYFRYQKIFQTFDNISLRLTKKFVAEKLSSSPWLYCKDVVGHFGCVNAIEFSNNGGEYLASGGDDTRVLVWKLAEAVRCERPTPRCLKSTHLSNIFCVAFNSRNTHVISAGNDDRIFVHDFERGDLCTSLAADNATYHISIHPDNDNILIAAGEVGVVSLYDLRTPADVVQLAKGPPAYHSAVFNPIDPSVYATASSVRGIQLWDARRPMRCLKRFDGGAGVQCAMGVAFDRTGQYLAAVRRKLPPVLYHIRRNTSLVEFCQEGYYNSCTMKSVCFAGKNDNFIISGSDDFNVYVWEVPFVEQDHKGIAKVERSFLTLHGHRSIVNQVCFNNTTSMLCTAGVEKIIKMWSPFPFNGDMNEGYIGSRRVPYSRLEYARMIVESGRPLAHDYDDESTSEDPRMIAFFDSLVQREREISSSDTDEDEGTEMSVRNAEILRTLREIVYGQLRSELNQEDGDEEVVQSSTDSSRIGSPEQRTSDSETNDESLSTMNSETSTSSHVDNETSSSSNLNNETSSSSHINNETSSSSNINETLSSSNVNNETSSHVEMPPPSGGVGLDRLREILASQQRSVTNMRRIAALRRECFTNDDDDTSTTTSSLNEALESKSERTNSTSTSTSLNTSLEQSLQETNSSLEESKGTNFRTSLFEASINQGSKSTTSSLNPSHEQTMEGTNSTTSSMRTLHDKSSSQNHVTHKNRESLNNREGAEHSHEMSATENKDLEQTEQETNLTISSLNAPFEETHGITQKSAGRSSLNQNVVTHKTMESSTNNGETSKRFHEVSENSSATDSKDFEQIPQGTKSMASSLEDGGRNHSTLTKEGEKCSVDQIEHRNVSRTT